MIFVCFFINRQNYIRESIAFPKNIIGEIMVYVFFLAYVAITVTFKKVRNEGCDRYVQAKNGLHFFKDASIFITSHKRKYDCVFFAFCFSKIVKYNTIYAPL